MTARPRVTSASRRAAGPAQRTMAATPRGVSSPLRNVASRPAGCRSGCDSSVRPGIRRVEHLEPSVEEETIYRVGALAAADVRRRLDDDDRAARPGKTPSAAEAREPPPTTTTSVSATVATIDGTPSG